LDGAFFHHTPRRKMAECNGAKFQANKEHSREGILPGELREESR